MLEQRYRTVIRELESRGIMPDRPPTIEPTREGLRRLNTSYDASKVIVVAGTNGKGSVCATLEKLLSESGERVGLYTSPHLIETTERIRVAQNDVSREVFVRAFDSVLERTSDLKLSHFEMLTLMAMWIFSSGHCGQPVDRIILEVGLGGTWDSTNAIAHATCVITSIGLDHQNILGHSLQDIALNKFGIVPKKSELGREAIVVHAKFQNELSELAERTKVLTNSHWTQSQDWNLEVDSSREEPRFYLVSKWGRAEISLPGARGAENSALALTAFEELGYDPRKYLACLKEIRWPGRMEKIAVRPCPIYVSGDHNVPGVQSLLDLLKFYRREKLHILVGIGQDKEADAMLEMLSAIPHSALYLTVTPFKGRSIANYGSWSNRVCGRWANPKDAISEVFKRANPGDMIVITGSLYLVGELRSVSLT